MLPDKLYGRKEKNVEMQEAAQISIVELQGARSTVIQFTFMKPKPQYNINNHV